ncbi:transglutaminaseTgpA domain-containing protein [Pseudoalteromonas sp. SSDWG2]|uniref:transglutaminase family protein n=1 Tax=Pseudoalteromonas sp. SSDWG2 TaxID=3139391 RepID=UPI003BADB924
MVNFASIILSLIYIGILALISDEFPTMLLSVLLLLCLWNLLLATERTQRPGPLVINLLAAALLAVLFITVTLKQNVLLFVTMLLQASILKLLQARTAHTLKNVAVLTFFCISTVFLFKQSLYASVAVALFFIGLTAALAALSGVKKSRVAFVKAFQSLLVALPLAAIMLVFVPKLPAFWKLPGASSAKTGLNEKVDPFNIASLAKSDELVFRAEFPNGPSQGPYYWRAILHEEFDGKAWNKRDEPMRLRLPSEQTQGTNSATIYLEKTSNRWLYTLGYGESNSDEVHNLRDGLLRRKNMTASSFQYPLKYSFYQTKVLNDTLVDYYTALPQQGNPRSRELARKLKLQTSTTEEFIGALYQYYAEQGFSYTLTPTPITGSDSLDIFLTQTQRGFCGHYASVSAFIMRSAGIPARLVSGYLGGEQITKQNYLAVYQYDAHAWVEYHDGEQWQRFDATAVVAPERLNGSLSQVQELQQEFLDNLDFGLLQLGSFESLQWLRLKLEEMDYTWTKWVLGFDREKQSTMLKDLLGNRLAQYSMVIVVLSIGFILLLLLIIHSRKPKIIMSFSAIQVKKLFDKAEELGLLSAHQLTPLQQLDYLAKQHPNLSQHIHLVKTLYVEEAYQQQQLEKQQQSELAKSVNLVVKSLR